MPLKTYLEKAIRSIELEEPNEAKRILADTIKLLNSEEKKVREEQISKTGLYVLYWDTQLHSQRIDDVEVVEVFVDGKMVYEKKAK